MVNRFNWGFLENLSWDGTLNMERPSHDLGAVENGGETVLLLHQHKIVYLQP
jgi:hypothetical protein